MEAFYNLALNLVLHRIAGRGKAIFLQCLCMLNQDEPQRYWRQPYTKQGWAVSKQGAYTPHHLWLRLTSRGQLSVLRPSLERIPLPMPPPAVPSDDARAKGRQLAELCLLCISLALKVLKLWTTFKHNSRGFRLDKWSMHCKVNDVIPPFSVYMIRECPLNKWIYAL